MRSVAVAALVLVVVSTARAADAPPDGGFSLPLSCKPGETCWVMNYPDVSEGGGGDEARDHACGPRSYKGHKGTDFAIRDLAAMRQGVPVLAAAPGRVLRVRDGVADRLLAPDDAEQPASPDGRECGNGAAIDHGAGWESQYCHLRRGSLAVKPGQNVARGEALGMVGASGRTAFPHVHIVIRKDGRTVDPATGRALEAPCGPGGRSLWRSEARLGYQPVVVYAAGFAPWPMKSSAIRERAAGRRTLPADARAIVLWTALFGVQEGDRMTLQILAPDGTPVTRSRVVVARTQAWRLQYGGKKLTTLEWPTGTYNGLFRIERPSASPPVRIERRLKLLVE